MHPYRYTCICPDLWCPTHARCGLCDGPVIITDDDPAFCPACGHDVMPRNACRVASVNPEGEA